MEYTKDMILQVNYGQVGEIHKRKYNFLKKLTNTISRHRIITTIISLTFMLMILDFMLISSFVQILAE